MHRDDRPYPSKRPVGITRRGGNVTHKSGSIGSTNDNADQIAFGDKIRLLERKNWEGARAVGWWLAEPDVAA